MRRWLGMGAAVVGLAAGWGCSQSREDRAREQGHQAQENADRDLQQARDKLRQELDRAGQQTKQDLDKARDQFHQALSQSERDAEKARQKLREKRQNNQDRQNGADGTQR